MVETAFRQAKQLARHGGSLPDERQEPCRSTGLRTHPSRCGTARGIHKPQGLTTAYYWKADAYAFATYTHCSSMAVPNIDTASMDRLTLSSTKSLRSDQNLQLLASVTATGRSSMNVDLDGNDWVTPTSVVTASFTFVARSGSTYGPVGV